MTTDTDINDFESLDRAHRGFESRRPACGDVVDVISLSSGPGRVELPRQPRRLSDFTGFTFFTLGPVYTFCGVSTDIIESLKDMTASDSGIQKFDPHRIVLRLQEPVLMGCANAWDYTLEGVDSESFVYMSKLLDTQQLRTHSVAGESQYWRIVHGMRTVVDPVLRSNKEVASDLDRAVIHVFVPSGNIRRAVINPLVTDIVRLDLTKPDPAVVAEARIMLGTVKERTG